MMDVRVRLQLAEAFSALNRWYCSQAHCREIDDQDMLLVHYIRNGGAEDFAKRFEEAMGPQNRWYCSEFHHTDVRDPLILWEYYHVTSPRRRR
jgi:hypothetical protein